MAFKIPNPLHLHATGHTEDPTDPKPKKQTKKENTEKILSSTPSGGTSATSDKIMKSYQKKKISATQME